MSIGIFLIPFGMLYEDFQRGVQPILGVWFFLTPIVYPIPKDGFAVVIADLIQLVHY